MPEVEKELNKEIKDYYEKLILERATDKLLIKYKKRINLLNLTLN